MPVPPFLLPFLTPLTTGGLFGISNGSYSPTISISRNKITRNRHGIYQGAGSWISSRIIGNIISDNEERGIYTLTGNSIIIQNTITGNSIGIWEQAAGTAEIKGNIIKGNTIGIRVDYLSSPNISENIITGNVERGIELHRNARAAIYRNTISGSAIGINVILQSAAIASFNICDDPISVGEWSTVVGIYNARSDGTPVLMP